MGSVSELLNQAAAETRKMGIVYIVSEDDGKMHSTFNYDTGEVGQVPRGEIPDGAQVINCQKCFAVDRTVGYVTEESNHMALVILRGTTGIPAFTGLFDKPDVELSEEGWQFDILFETDKFLGLGTYGESPRSPGSDSVLFGSSAYYEWDGERYTQVIGELDNWIAGEMDIEYEVSEDGQSLVMLTGRY